MDGKRSGLGTMNYKSGNVYIGSWYDDHYNGYGELTKPGESKYCGDFKNGKFHGPG